VLQQKNSNHQNQTSKNNNSNKKKTDSDTNNEGVVKRSKNASNTENMFTILNSWTQCYCLFLWLPNLSLRRLSPQKKKKKKYQLNRTSIALNQLEYRCMYEHTMVENAVLRFEEFRVLNTDAAAGTLSKEKWWQCLVFYI